MTTPQIMFDCAVLVPFFATCVLCALWDQIFFKQKKLNSWLVKSEFIYKKGPSLLTDFELIRRMFQN